MDMEAAIQEVNELIDLVSSPSKMSKEQYADFLISLRDEVEIRFAAVQQDLERERG